MWRSTPGLDTSSFVSWSGGKAKPIKIVEFLGAPFRE
jgi:hypothetical protein